MDRKSRILLYVFFFLFVGTVLFSFFRYMIFRDFEVIYTTSESAEDMSSDEPAIDTWATEEAENNIEVPSE